MCSSIYAVRKHLTEKFNIEPTEKDIISVQRVGEGKNSIAVPFYLTSKELSELKRLKDQKEELDRKKKAEEKLKNSWETEAEKEKIREKINLIEKEENYQEAEDKLTLQLKKTYLGNIQQFMDLLH